MRVLIPSYTEIRSGSLGATLLVDGGKEFQSSAIQDLSWIRHEQFLYPDGLLAARAITKNSRACCPNLPEHPQT